MVARMEKDIDRLTAELPEMRQFILPGGSRPGAALHLCRTVCRRAERKAVQLAREETVSTHVLAYLNRLSDLLFVLARAANLRAGGREIPWVAPKP
jgi:cob(I)alamin adenosyltransferase